MDKRLSRSYIERDPSTINQTYIITVDSINYYFKFVYDSLQDNRIIQDSNLSSSYFVLKSYDEIHETKLNQLREIERYASFDIRSDHAKVSETNEKQAV